MVYSDLTKNISNDIPIIPEFFRTGNSPDINSRHFELRTILEQSEQHWNASNNVRTAILESEQHMGLETRFSEISKKKPKQ